MGKVIATISMSVDGYVTGPGDGPSRGLGAGGEPLHYWVMGGPWTYGSEHDPERMEGADRVFFDELVENVGSGIVGRNMYDAAGAWGGTNPFGGTLYVLTHRTEVQPDPQTGFVFVDDFAEALARARQSAAGQDVTVSGGADVIRQALAGDHVDELAISVAPVILGSGKQLFDGFDRGMDLQILKVYCSPWATHVRYAVGR